jgi:hypothetical protein
MIEFLTSNWAELAGVLALFVVAFEKLAKVTPTKTDNKIVAFLQKVFTVLGVKVEDNQGSV